MGLRLKLFGYCVRKHAKRHMRQKQFVDYAHAKKILLLYESDPTENRAFIDEAVRALHADGKQTDVVSYVAKKQCEKPSEAHFVVLDKAQISFWGKPQKATLNAIAAQQYDLLIDLTQTFCLPLQYALLYANAKCKVGGDVSQYGLIDFAVKVTPAAENKQHEHALWNAILRYLKEIKQCETV